MKDFFGTDKKFLFASFPQLARAVLSRGALKVADGPFWTWSYTLPPDCLEVFPEDTHLGDVEFVIEGDRLLCDLEAHVWLRYVRQVTDPGQWDPAFAEVLSWKLAMEMQPELAPTVSSFTLSSGFESALQRAYRSGAVERSYWNLSWPYHGRSWEEARQ